MPSLAEKLLKLYQGVFDLPRAGAMRALEIMSPEYNPGVSYYAPEYETINGVKVHRNLHEPALETGIPIRSIIPKLGKFNPRAYTRFQTILNSRSSQFFSKAFEELSPYERGVAFIAAKYPKLFEKATSMGFDPKAILEEGTLGLQSTKLDMLPVFRDVKAPGERLVEHVLHYPRVMPADPSKKPTRWDVKSEIKLDPINQLRDIGGFTSNWDKSAVETLTHELAHYLQSVLKPTKYASEDKLIALELDKHADEVAKTGMKAYKKMGALFPEGTKFIPFPPKTQLVR